MACRYSGLTRYIQSFSERLSELTNGARASLLAALIAPDEHDDCLRFNNCF